jgi:pimeloyl-ACP methyl ester carboxylesterase
VDGVIKSELAARTADGVRLSIQRLTPKRGPQRGAVVLQHGLGSNGLAFVLPGVSLAEHLCGLGYDCFVPDLRGAGKSERPPRPYTLDDYIEHDIPTILATTLEASGASEVSWVGHSMGGILMWMHGIEQPNTKVARLVTVGSALDYRPGRSVYRTLAALLPYASFLRTLPFGGIARMHSLIAGRGPILMTEGMNFFRSNIDREVCRAIMAGGFGPIPISLFQSLASTFSDAGFSRRNGELAYLERASAFRIPTLLLGGSRDPQCPVEATTHTAELLSSVRDKQLLLFGKPYGHVDDYGHFDLLVGKRAATEVWPHITAFLGAGDSLGETASAIMAQ